MIRYRLSKGMTIFLPFSLSLYLSPSFLFFSFPSSLSFFLPFSLPLLSSLSLFSHPSLPSSSSFSFFFTFFLLIFFSISHSIFIFCLEAIPGGIQAFHPTLCSVIIPGSAQLPYIWLLHIKPGSATCKASSLPNV